MGITELFYPGSDEAADLMKLQQFYQNVNARFPEKFNNRFAE